MDENDCERFQMLLYTCNSSKPIHISNLWHAPGKSPAISQVLEIKRGEQLVDIAAYCLMPNHLHLLLREIDYGGISSFMQRVGTGYTMFFNKKYGRTGALFSGKFKSVHIGSDTHSRRVINYIHANAAELYEPGWKDGIVRNEKKLKNQLLAYPYSSLIDYESKERPQACILAKDAARELVDAVPSFKALLDDARAFYNYEKDMLPELETQHGKARPCRVANVEDRK